MTRSKTLNKNKVIELAKEKTSEFVLFKLYLNFVIIQKFHHLILKDMITVV
jgi:hypothetical protein